MEIEPKELRLILSSLKEKNIGQGGAKIAPLEMCAVGYAATTASEPPFLYSIVFNNAMPT